MNGIELYFRLAKASIAAQIRYPRAFAIQLVGHLAATLIGFVGIWTLFHRFGAVGGWSLAEIAVFFGMINICFACADALGRGFDIFGSEYVRTGAFDRLLLRPRTTILQVLCHQLRLRPIGRLLQGSVVLCIGLHGAGTQPLTVVLPMIAWTICGGTALFIGILIGQASLSFRTIESLEFVNVLTYGGVEAGQYPFPLYARWFRALMTWVFPLGAISYYPVTVIIGHRDPGGAPGWLCAAYPLMGFAFLAAMLLVWREAVRRYTSSGG